MSYHWGAQQTAVLNSNGGKALTAFATKSKGKQIPYYRTGSFVQEYITNPTYVNVGPVTPWNPSWVPAAAGSTTIVLQTSGGVVYDIRACPAPDANAPPVMKAYNSVNVGSAFFTATQQLRVMIPDNCGKYTAYPIAGTFSIKYIKAANNQFTAQIE